MGFTISFSGSGASPAPTDASLSSTERAWIDVDLAALVENARTIAAISGARLLPMVKANGYGLGAIPVARALEAVEPWGAGIGTIEEGVELRAAGYARPLLLATPLLPEWIDDALAYRIRPFIGDLTALDAWTARTAEPFHIEIDSGMSRGGFRWDDRDAIAALAARLAKTGNAWEGIATHFHSADSDPAATERQWERFQAVLAALPHRPPLVHAANSGAALCGSRYAGDLIRPGIFLYGGHGAYTGGTGHASNMAAGNASVAPAIPADSIPAPKPVAAFRARVVALRTVAAGDTVSYGAAWRAEQPTIIATLAAGYADGILRAAHLDLPVPRVVELAGQRVPIVGRVTMDMCMVAVPPSVALGDVATIFGGLVSLDDQARAAGTIGYELLTALGRRLPRRYRGM